MQPMRKDTMSQLDVDFNDDARFLPRDPRDPYSLPCVTIGGAQVYTYFRDGELHISVNYDDIATTTLPTIVTLSDMTVYPLPDATRNT